MSIYVIKKSNPNTKLQQKVQAIVGIIDSIKRKKQAKRF